MFKYSTKVRNARLDAIRTVIGPAPIMKFFARRESPLVEDSDPQGLLAEIHLPHTWLNPASNSVITLDGNWQGRARETGIIRSFRLFDKKGYCHLQGSVSLPGQGGDLILSNTSVVPGQQVTVDAFTIVSSNGATVLDKNDLPLSARTSSSIVRDGERVHVPRTT